MKFTEALVLGSALFQRVLRGRCLGPTGDSGCAMGMAGVAAGLDLWPSHLAHEFSKLTERVNQDKVTAHWPWLKLRLLTMSCSCYRDGSVCDGAEAVIHLFDVHRASTEQIAVLLRPLEAKLDVEVGDGVERVDIEELVGA